MAVAVVSNVKELSSGSKIGFLRSKVYSGVSAVDASFWNNSQQGLARHPRYANGFFAKDEQWASFLNHAPLDNIQVLCKHLAAASPERLRNVASDQSCEAFRNNLLNCLRAQIASLEAVIKSAPEFLLNLPLENFVDLLKSQPKAWDFLTLGWEKVRSADKKINSQRLLDIYRGFDPACVKLATLIASGRFRKPKTNEDKFLVYLLGVMSQEDKLKLFKAHSISRVQEFAGVVLDDQAAEGARVQYKQATYQVLSEKNSKKDFELLLSTKAKNKDERKVEVDSLVKQIANDGRANDFTYMRLMARRFEKKNFFGQRTDELDIPRLQAGARLNGAPAATDLNRPRALSSADPTPYKTLFKFEKSVTLINSGGFSEFTSLVEVAKAHDIKIGDSIPASVERDLTDNVAAISSAFINHGENPHFKGRENPTWNRVRSAEVATFVAYLPEDALAQQLSRFYAQPVTISGNFIPMIDDIVAAGASQDPAYWVCEPSVSYLARVRIDRLFFKRETLMSAALEKYLVAHPRSVELLQDSDPTRLLNLKSSNLPFLLADFINAATSTGVDHRFVAWVAHVLRQDPKSFDKFWSRINPEKQQQVRDTAQCLVARLANNDIGYHGERAKEALFIMTSMHAAKTMKLSRRLQKTVQYTLDPTDPTRCLSVNYNMTSLARLAAMGDLTRQELNDLALMDDKDWRVFKQAFIAGYTSGDFFQYYAERVKAFKDHLMSSVRWDFFNPKHRIDYIDNKGKPQKYSPDQTEAFKKVYAADKARLDRLRVLLGLPSTFDIAREIYKVWLLNNKNIDWTKPSKEKNRTAYLRNEAHFENSRVILDLESGAEITKDMLGSWNLDDAVGKAADHYKEGLTMQYHKLYGRASLPSFEQLGVIAFRRDPYFNIRDSGVSKLKAQRERFSELLAFSVNPRACTSFLKEVYPLQDAQGNIDPEAQQKNTLLLSDCFNVDPLLLGATCERMKKSQEPTALPRLAIYSQVFAEKMLPKIKWVSEDPVQDVKDIGLGPDLKNDHIGENKYRIQDGKRVIRVALTQMFQAGYAVFLRRLQHSPSLGRTIARALMSYEILKKNDGVDRSFQQEKDCENSNSANARELSKIFLDAIRPTKKNKRAGINAFIQAMIQQKPQGVGETEQLLSTMYIDHVLKPMAHALAADVCRQELLLILRDSVLLAKIKKEIPEFLQELLLHLPADAIFQAMPIVRQKESEKQTLSWLDLFQELSVDSRFHEGLGRWCGDLLMTVASSSTATQFSNQTFLNFAKNHASFEYAVFMTKTPGGAEVLKNVQNTDPLYEKVAVRMADPKEPERFAELAFGIVAIIKVNPALGLACIQKNAVVFSKKILAALTKADCGSIFKVIQNDDSLMTLALQCCPEASFFEYVLNAKAHNYAPLIEHKDAFLVLMAQKEQVVLNHFGVGTENINLRDFSTSDGPIRLLEYVLENTQIEPKFLANAVAHRFSYDRQLSLYINGHTEVLGKYLFSNDKSKDLSLSLNMVRLLKPVFFSQELFSQIIAQLAHADSAKQVELLGIARECFNPSMMDAFVAGATLDQLACLLRAFENQPNQITKIFQERRMGVLSLMAMPKAGIPRSVFDLVLNSKNSFGLELKEVSALFDHNTSKLHNNNAQGVFVLLLKFPGLFSEVCGDESLFVSEVGDANLVIANLQAFIDAAEAGVSSSVARLLLEALAPIDIRNDRIFESLGNSRDFVEYLISKLASRETLALIESMKVISSRLRPAVDRLLDDESIDPSYALLVKLLTKQQGPAGSLALIEQVVGVGHDSLTRAVLRHVAENPQSDLLNHFQLINLLKVWVDVEVSRISRLDQPHLVTLEDASFDVLLLLVDKTYSHLRNHFPIVDIDALTNLGAYRGQQSPVKAIGGKPSVKDTQRVGFHMPAPRDDTLPKTSPRGSGADSPTRSLAPTTHSN